MEFAFSDPELAVFRNEFLPGQSALVFSNNSSNVSAFTCPTFSRILSVVRRNTFAYATASASPRKVTFPSSTLLTSYPRSIISLFSTASVPKWQGALSAQTFSCYPLFPVSGASSKTAEKPLLHFNLLIYFTMISMKTQAVSDLLLHDMHGYRLSLT